MLLKNLRTLRLLNNVAHLLKLKFTVVDLPLYAAVKALKI